MRDELDDVLGEVSARDDIRASMRNEIVDARSVVLFWIDNDGMRHSSWINLDIDMIAYSVRVANQLLVDTYPLETDDDEA